MPPKASVRQQKGRASEPCRAAAALGPCGCRGRDAQGGQPEGCGAAVRFPWHCRAPRLKPCCLSAPAPLAQTANVLHRGCCCSFLQSPGYTSFPLSLPFPTFPLPLIRLALHGTDNTCAYPIKRAHSRRWTVCKSQERHQKNPISHGFLQCFSFLSP